MGTRTWEQGYLVIYWALMRGHQSLGTRLLGHLLGSHAWAQEPGNKAAWSPTRLSCVGTRAWERGYLVTYRALVRGHQSLGTRLLGHLLGSRAWAPEPGNEATWSPTGLSCVGTRTWERGYLVTYWALVRGHQNLGTRLLGHLLGSRAWAPEPGNEATWSSTGLSCVGTRAWERGYLVIYWALVHGHQSLGTRLLVHLLGSRAWAPEPGNEATGSPTGHGTSDCPWL